MPEIGEIQAHGERLAADWVGKTLEKFRPITFYVLKTFSPDPTSAHGQTLRSVSTRGKYLKLAFDETTFLIHLMQGGRLRPDASQTAKPRNGQARWTFDDGTALLLTEAGSDKRAGIWVFDNTTELDDIEPLSKLGPNADQLSGDQLAEILSEHSMRIHGLLRRQGIISGIGRRLANDVCHAAQISPFATASKLKPEQVDALHTAIGECIDTSLEFERAQTEIVASTKRPSAVHNKTGDQCPVCSDTIREVAYVKYSINYCPTCQTNGKVLADNTTSKFLK